MFSPVCQANPSGRVILHHTRSIPQARCWWPYFLTFVIVLMWCLLCVQSNLPSWPKWEGCSPPSQIRTSSLLLTASRHARLRWFAKLQHQNGMSTSQCKLLSMSGVAEKGGMLIQTRVICWWNCLNTSRHSQNVISALPGSNVTLLALLLHWSVTLSPVVTTGWNPAIS